MVNNMKKRTNNKGISLINKLLICTIFFLVIAIISKNNTDYKEKIKNYLYNNNFNFSKIRNIYNEYLGGITIIKEDKIKQVFEEKIDYNKKDNYEDGVKLEVKNNYLIPNQEKGIVVFIGNKDKYNNSIIIENDNGIDILYGNICNPKVKLYDTINKSAYIGESCNNYIYLVYYKGNEILDYNNYLS